MSKGRHTAFAHGEFDGLVGTKIGRAYLCVRRGFRAGTVDVGLTPVEFAVMARIRGGNVQQSSLSTALSVSMQNLTTILEKLQQRGLITRGQSQKDRRVRPIRLTTAGDDLMDQGAARLMIIEDQLTQKMTPGEKAIFLELLDKIYDPSSDASEDTEQVNDRTEDLGK